MAVTGGNATFSVPSNVASQFPYNKVDVTLPLPANLDVGVSYQISNKVMIGLDFNYVFWSAYDSLIFNFNSDTSKVAHTLSSSTPRLYKNRLIVRGGVQWNINSMFTVRAGGYFDPSPVPTDYMDPMLPSSDETGITCGVSIYPLKGFSIDISFEYLMGALRTGTYSPENFAGTYRTAFYMPGFGLTYNF